MVDATRFRLVFDELEGEIELQATLDEVAKVSTEAEEIAELRRIVLEVTDAPVATFTTT